MCKDGLKLFESFLIAAMPLQAVQADSEVNTKHFYSIKAKAKSKNSNKMLFPATVNNKLH